MRVLARRKYLKDRELKMVRELGDFVNDEEYIFEDEKLTEAESKQLELNKKIYKYTQDRWDHLLQKWEINVETINKNIDIYRHIMNIVRYNDDTKSKFLSARFITCHINSQTSWLQFFATQFCGFFCCFLIWE